MRGLTGPTSSTRSPLSRNAAFATANTSRIPAAAHRDAQRVEGEQEAAIEHHNLVRQVEPVLQLIERPC